MRKTIKGFLFAAIALTVLLTTAFGATFFLSRGHDAHAAFAGPSATKATAPQVAFHTINMATVPTATGKSLSATSKGHASPGCQALGTDRKRSTYTKCQDQCEHSNNLRQVPGDGRFYFDLSLLWRL